MIREEIVRDRFDDRILTVLMEWSPTKSIKDGHSAYASHIITKRQMMYMQQPLMSFQRDRFEELWEKVYDKICADFNVKPRSRRNYDLRIRL